MKAGLDRLLFLFTCLAQQGTWVKLQAQAEKVVTLGPGLMAL